MSALPQTVLDEFTWHRCIDCGEINPSPATGDRGEPVCPDCGSPSLAEQVAPDLDSLIVDGVSFKPALDYWAVELHGWTQSDWADARGVSQGTVSGNIDQAEEIVEDESDMKPWHDGRCERCNDPLLDTHEGDVCYSCQPHDKVVRNALQTTGTGPSPYQREKMNAIHEQVAENGHAEIYLRDDSDDGEDLVNDPSERDESG